MSTPEGYRGRVALGDAIMLQFPKLFEFFGPGV